MDFNNLFPFMGDPDDENENNGFELSGSAFIIGPDGKPKEVPFDVNNIGAALENLKKKFDKVAQDTNTFSIFNGEYFIKYIDSIQTEDGVIDSMYLECVQNIRMKPSRNFIEVLHYLSASQFINFLLAFRYGVSTWDTNSIKLNFYMDESKPLIAPKISIIAENLSSSIPTWVGEIASKDYIYDSYAYTVTHGGLTLMSSVKKAKAFYEPLICYDLKFALPSDAPLTFYAISIYHFYNQFILEHLKEIVTSFYPISMANSKYPNEYTNSIHTHFTIDVSDNLVSMQIIASPALLEGAKGEFYNYAYIGDDFQTVSIDPVTDNDMGDIDTLRTLQFFNRTFSSSRTQMLALLSEQIGVTSYMSKDAILMGAQFVLFNTDRHITNSDRTSYIADGLKIKPMANYNSIINLKEIINTSRDESEDIISLWIPNIPEPKSLYIDTAPYNEIGTLMHIYGFMNIRLKNVIDKTFAQLVLDNKDILAEVLKIPTRLFTMLENKEYGSFGIVEAYRDSSSIRLLLWEPKENVRFVGNENPINKEPSNNKNKRGWFK